MNIIENAKKLRPIIEEAIKSLSDEVALSAVELFPKWKTETAYEVDDRITYEDILYKVLTAHTSQSDWTPDVSPSLFAEVLIPDEEIIPEWVQPDSTNAYMIGDKVTYNGQTWVSIVDNNVWAPGAYGWEVVE